MTDTSLMIATVTVFLTTFGAVFACALRRLKAQRRREQRNKAVQQVLGGRA